MKNNLKLDYATLRAKNVYNVNYMSHFNTILKYFKDASNIILRYRHIGKELK